ncbi:MAG: LrgB family protein [Pseudomonadales bacterium]|nr:LrgB family protein [Pseudomonadales bacterium]
MPPLISTLLTAFTHPSAMLVTIVGYLIGLVIYRKSEQKSWLHPVILGIFPIMLFLQVFNLDYAAYRLDSSPIHFLLGPATVALAVPLYNQLHLIRPIAKAILITLVVGAISASAIGVLMAYLLDLQLSILLTLSAKSVTTPISMAIAESIGGVPILAAGIVITTGVIGAIFAPMVFSICKVDDDRVRGFTLGLNAHGVGTARAFGYGELAGAFSSLALSLTGTITAIFLPIVVSLCS